QDLYLFFFHSPATTELYTLSLHDALPICQRESPGRRIKQRVLFRRIHGHVEFIGHGGIDELDRDVGADPFDISIAPLLKRKDLGDRKSTRLNSSHVSISYAVFCLKKKNIQ